MEAFVPLITQLISGAIGGNAVAAILKQQATSIIVRTIIGAIGGIGGGLLMQAFGGEAGLSNLVANGIGGLIGGGVLQAIAGVVMGRKQA